MESLLAKIKSTNVYTYRKISINILGLYTGLLLNKYRVVECFEGTYHYIIRLYSSRINYRWPILLRK